MRIVAAILLALATAACGGSVDDGIVDVAFIAAPDELQTDGLRLDFAGEHLRAATAQGLVALDASGAVVPAVAERWIVTDDGSSYIFRIHEYDMENGTRLTAQAVRDNLRRTLRRLEGTSLGLDLAKVREVRAMTGRVIEIRLTSPMPDLLQLLAQPELGLIIDKRWLGPMRLVAEDDVVVLDAQPPEARGLPSQPGWEDAVSRVRVYAESAKDATEGFGDGRFDLVLGGTIATLPLADTGPLTRGTIRLDAALGLFGLDVQKPTGFLGTSENREALAMAIDRANLLQAFNIGGWIPTTRVVAPGLPGDGGTVSERWTDLDLGERKALAQSRVAQWRAGLGPPRVSIGLPEGPGSDRLFTALARDFAAIGVSASRASDPAKADLVLRDRVARFGAASWFLNQFNCRVSKVVCAEGTDYLVGLANEAKDPAEEASYLAEAEQALTATNLYIPLGAPIRWSLVRGDIGEFLENRWNIHPLFPLSRAPI
ncbi:ABC transporter substrate-binding protein [Erythrobacter mangrovi]|uniref:Peptide ABC transporter substrate-binding protein n=1 Tax=Erythrobacter mangrovi TaxID=2739433 RepID=A0A7D4B7D2_9SPHN|nr:ABC transporter substrate-binding protein [Erythrobacter mangrovi]QKG71063.1 peptide ABC transporter substrate-binding protein [Erythrobacter mangrovi]